MAEQSQNTTTVVRTPGEDPAPASAANTTSPGPNAQDPAATINHVPAGTTTESSHEAGESWTFGRYQVGRLLGKGGMGEVFLAQDTLLQRTVALKIPKLTEGRSAERERFLREARAAAILTHPNICPVYDVGEIDGRPYLTMAYVDGSSLAVRVRQAGPLAPLDAAHLVRTVARAMQHAHDQGILHRDLKPANILLNGKGEPTVTDFGLAFRLDDDTSERLTEQGLLIGTPFYMPPEQINGQRLAPMADVYSLGMVLYELLTGKVAFQAPLGKLLAQIDSTPPPPPSQSRPDVPPLLETITLKALAKRPQDRFASMAALAEALADYCMGRGGLDDTSAKVVLRRPRRLRRWVALATVLCSAAAACVIVWLAQDRPPAQTGAPGPAHAGQAPPAPKAVDIVLPVDQKAAEVKRLFAWMQKPTLRIEAVGTKEKPLRLARDSIPAHLLKKHDGPLNFTFSGSGSGHVIDMTDQPAQGMDLYNFSDGDVVVRAAFFTFLNNLGHSVRVCIKGGPGYSLLCPVAMGRGSEHVEFDGTHLILPKNAVPTIDKETPTTAERASLRNPKLTRKLIIKYDACSYVIYTNPDTVVVPGNIDERRADFPEIHNLIELERQRMFTARTILWQRILEAMQDGKKK
jgi:hypothetical protein